MEVVLIIVAALMGFLMHKLMYPYRANYDKLGGASYSQMGIYVNGKKYKPLDECILAHERKTGWTVWDRDAAKPLGSERQGNICITVNGVAVIGKGKIPHKEGLTLDPKLINQSMYEMTRNTKSSMAPNKEE